MILVLFKPDCVARGLVGECLARFERRGFAIVRLRALAPCRELLEAHYAEHAGRPYFDALIDDMAGRPAVAAVLALGGAGVVAGLMAGAGRVAAEVALARALQGPWDGPPAGTIRGDYALSPRENTVHVSDSPAAATREIALWFATDWPDDD